VTIAVAVNANGRLEVLGIAIDTSAADASGLGSCVGSSSAGSPVPSSDL
jgi:hypothetical protein